MDEDADKEVRGLGNDRILAMSPSNAATRLIENHAENLAGDDHQDIAVID